MSLPVTEPFLQFTLLVVIALVMQLALQRTRVPTLVGLLVAGMLVGPDGLNVLPREPVTELLGHIGLVYLMFLAGLEIDLDGVREHPRQTATFGLLAAGLSLAPAIGVGLLLGYEPLAAVLLGALLASHTLIAFPIIQRAGLLHRQSVSTTVSGTLVTDTIALLALVVVIQLAQREGPAWQAAQPIGLLALLAGVAWWGVPRLSRTVFSREWLTRAEKALYALVVLLGLAATAKLIGTEDILGAFLAGLALNRVLGKREDLLEHIEFAGRMLFIPFFFISTGMLLALNVFTGNTQVMQLAGILLLVILGGKAAATWITAHLYGYPTPDRWLMLGLTIPQAAATLAVTVTGREAGLFEDNVVDAVILVIFVTSIAGPLITRRAARRMNDHEDDQNRKDDTSGRTDHDTDRAPQGIEP